MVQFFTAGDGARLAYSDQGEGLPVLCLAGLTRNMGDFDYVAPHLAGVRLIRMDYRGRGQSDRTGAATYTVPQEGKDALALLDHLGIDRAAVLGTSRGGLIGMLLAAVAHDRLLGLCLNDVGPVIEQAGLDRIFDYVGRNPSARTHGALAERLPAAMAGFAGVWRMRGGITRKRRTGCASSMTRPCARRSWRRSRARRPTCGLCGMRRRGCRSR